jgi:hypothetical protein
MNLLVGGGSITLKTDTFENEQPEDLLVADELSTPVLEPIPPPPPQPVDNNVQSINFYNVVAGGFNLVNNLPIGRRQLQVTTVPLVLKISNNEIRIFVNGQWSSIQPFVWNGNSWSQIPAKIFNGIDWI